MDPQNQITLGKFNIMNDYNKRLKCDIKVVNFDIDSQTCSACYFFHILSWECLCILTNFFNNQSKWTTNALYMLLKREQILYILYQILIINSKPVWLPYTDHTLYTSTKYKATQHLNICIILTRNHMYTVGGF